LPVSRLSSLFLAFAGITSCTAAPSATGNARPAVNVPAARPPVAMPQPKPAPVETADTQVRTDFWIASDPVQGGLVTARAPSGATSVTLNGVAVPVESDGFFLIGFDRDAENSASLVATLANGKRIEKYLPVKPGNWRIENIDANPTGGAATSEEFQARRGPELAQINAARAIHSDAAGWRQEFIRPAPGRISGLFGAQRIYRGTPGSYHSGMDIAAGAGTIFVAPADGVVTLAAEQEFTLEGHLLMLDHGMGLNSAFLHCSSLLVKEGDHVKQGQPIGTVGATGRATGPHLHWGMKWNNARIDPRLLIPPQ
jgi:murein DD-endopeptidase MepM/ murein hydrolase activator NlpD